MHSVEDMEMDDDNEEEDEEFDEDDIENEDDQDEVYEPMHVRVFVNLFTKYLLNYYF